MTKPQSHEEIKEEFNELWNSHDGDHFYKDEFWDFIKSKLSQRDADKGGGCRPLNASCCEKCFFWASPTLTSCNNANCLCHSTKPQVKCGCTTKYCKHYESDFDRFVKAKPQANVGEDWKTEYPLNTFHGETYLELVRFISNLLSTTSAQKLEGLEREVEGLKQPVFSNQEDYGFFITKGYNEALTAVLDIIRKQK